MQSIILGPPGTGKTTAILNLIDAELQQGTAPERIGYFAFTKKASEEGRERTVGRFGLSPREIPNFRTLHSLCYKMLGLSRDAVMGKTHFKEFNDIMGMRLTGEVNLEEGSISMLSKDDKLRFIEGLARLRCVSLREQFHQHHSDDIDWYRLERYEKGLRQFKEARGIYDFTDMLELCVNKGLAPRLDAMFVDEAQDLSPLQWKLVSILTKNSDRVYIAGDDDQAIFRWAGADVDHLVGISKEAKILDKSYRIPKSVYKIANEIIGRVKQRTPKTWNSREEEGTVVSQASFEHVDIKEGEWLILSRSNYLLNEIEAHCLGLGVFFERKGRPSITAKKVTAVKNWERLRKGEQLFPDEAKETVAYIKESKGKPFENLEPSKKLTLKEVSLTAELSEPTIWHEMFTGLTPHERSYILAMLRAGEKITKKPRIKLSTIHSAKGGEADNVILLTDIPTKTWKSYEQQPDDETRVFYVGLTRAKHNLHIVQPKTNKYFML
jgi:superfamily I DNA/RNA helicase